MRLLLTQPVNSETGNIQQRRNKLFSGSLGHRDMTNCVVFPSLPYIYNIHAGLINASVYIKVHCVHYVHLLCEIYKITFCFCSGFLLAVNVKVYKQNVTIEYIYRMSTEGSYDKDRKK